jgi:hypothetical protein
LTPEEVFVLALLLLLPRDARDQATVQNKMPPENRRQVRQGGMKLDRRK